MVEKGAGDLTIALFDGGHGVDDRRMAVFGDGRDDIHPRFGNAVGGTECVDGRNVSIGVKGHCRGAIPLEKSVLLRNGL